MKHIRAAEKTGIGLSGLGRGAAALILLAGTLLLTLLGALSYSSILKSRDRSAALRGSLSYLSSQLRNHDASGCVELREEGHELVLSERSGDAVYELRIYLKDGYLVEEYVPAGSPEGAGSPVQVAAESLFSAEFIRPDVLKLQTGQGELLIHLRAEEGRT